MATVADNLKLVPLPKNTLIVARENGRLYTVDFTEFPQLDDPAVIDWNISVSKLIVGKIQSTRAQMLTLEEVEVENIVHTMQFPVGTAKDFQMTIFGSHDGKNNTITAEPSLAIDEGGYVIATCRLTAKNFQVQVRGTYNINTMTIAYHPAGRR